MNPRDKLEQPFAPQIGHKILLLTLFASLFVGRATALDPDKKLGDLFHRSWTVSEGAPSFIASMAQTSDGYLWFATPSGLYRFDGVHFESYEPPPPSSQLLSRNVGALFPDKTGGLWIGYMLGGIGFLKEDCLTNYTERDGLPRGSVLSFAADNEGVVWAAATGGLACFRGNKWQKTGSEWNIPAGPIEAVSIDKQQTLWLSTERTLMFLPHGEKRFHTTEDLFSSSPRIREGPDGTLWLLEKSSTKLQVTGTRIYNGRRVLILNAQNVLFDREGGMWIAGGKATLLRIPHPGRLASNSTSVRGTAEESTLASGLSSNVVNQLLEDREGTIWVGTLAGLDQFRESRVSIVPLPGTGFSLAREHDGVMLVGSSEYGLLQVEKGRVTRLKGPSSVDHIYVAPDGSLFYGTFGHLWRRKGKELDHIPLPNDHMRVHTIAEDQAGSLWASFARLGVFRLSHGEWAHSAKISSLPPLPAIIESTDAAGRVWFGYTESRAALLDGDKVRTFSSQQGLRVGNVGAITSGSKYVWVGGEDGLAYFDRDCFHSLAAVEPDAFSGISGIIATADGGLWLNGFKGILHIVPSEVKRAVRDSSQPVRFELYNYLDGLPGSAAQLHYLPSAVQSSSGELWFTTQANVVTIKPETIRKNSIIPPVHIRALVANGRTFQVRSQVELPPNISSLEIRYTALSLVIPERVRFRYQMEGLDQDWQDAGTRREAFYTKLPPGRYRFRVIACNNDGMWNLTGASANILIAPSFSETLWFKLFCAAFSLLLIWSFLRLRFQRALKRVQMQFRERVAERERVARDLHDTLLQSFLGASLQVHAAFGRLDETSPAKQPLGRALQLIERASDQGRITLRGLRLSQRDNSALEESFASIAAEFEAVTDSEFLIRVEGQPRPVRDALRDDIYRIGREAIVNALMHSAAKVIEVEIQYTRIRFRVRVRDNGHGIDPETLRSGREGHWGLRGMRERSDEIGARLSIFSKPGAGTEVILSVPAAMAFRVDEDSFGRRLLRALRGLKRGAERG